MDFMHTDGLTLYNSVKSNKTDLHRLKKEEAELLLYYLCSEAECGNLLDFEIACLCAEIICKETPSAEGIINRTYGRIGVTRKKAMFRRLPLRRLAAAAAAVALFVASGFATALALDVNLPQSVKIIMGEKKQQIVFEDYTNPNEDGTPQKKRIDGISVVFDYYLKEYIYPAYLPDGITPYRITRYPVGGRDIFTVKLKADDEDWIFSASDAKTSYLPMGYEYSNGDLDFIYTVSRRGNEIIKFDVYTVFNGVQYRFCMHTDSKDTVFEILDSLKP